VKSMTSKSHLDQSRVY